MMAGLAGNRRDIEMYYTVPGEPCRRVGIDEGKLTLVSINEITGVAVVHCASRTSWWGQANHYCPSKFMVFSFDPEKIENIDNTKRKVWVLSGGDIRFQANRKTWPDGQATDAKVIY